MQITIGMEIRADECSRSDFNVDFTMYGGTARTPRTIPLYNYQNSFRASRLSLKDEPFLKTGDSNHDYSNRLPPVYAPGELNYDYSCNIVIKLELEDTHCLNYTLCDSIGFAAKFFCKKLIAIHYFNR